MLTRRKRYLKSYSQSESHARWMQVDASKQGGRNYELVLIQSCRTSDLNRAMSLVVLLVRFDHDDPTEASYLVEKNMIAELSRLLDLHRPPAVVLGSSSSSTVAKLCVTLHALFLEVGSSFVCRAFAEYINEIMVPTTDFGDEFGITLLEPIGVLQVFPWLQPPPANMRSCNNEDPTFGVRMDTNTKC